MAKKILAIICGKPNGETARAARVALLAAQEKGCEVELVNLMQLKILPCTGCNTCGAALRSPDKVMPCPLNGRDDMAWLDEQILSADAILLGAPMYEESVPGPFKTMTDRFGPSHDVTFQQKLYDARVAMGIDPQIDPRFFKKRPFAFFGLGGSEWQYLGYSTGGIPAIPMGFVPVDREEFLWNRNLLADESRVARMKQMGEHLAAMAQIEDPEQWTYIGPKGVCPVCHNDVVQFNEDMTEATCVLCGIIGQVGFEDGKLQITFTEEARTHAHILDSGREIHFKDLTSGHSPETFIKLKESAEKGKELMKRLPSTVPPKKEA